MAKRQNHQFNQRKAFIILLLIAVPVLCVTGIYLYGLNRYQTCFLNGTVIDQIDVSGMTISQLAQRIEGYVLKVEQRKADGTVLVEEISGSEIGLSYASMEPFEQILADQNSLLWFVRQENEQDTGNAVTFDENALKTEMERLSGFRKDFIVEPEDAFLSEYTPSVGFEIVPETAGNRLNKEKTFDTIRTAVAELQDYVNLSDAGCYETAKITSDNPALQASYEKLKKYTDITITYTFGDEQEILDGDTIVTWIDTDGADITLDETKVADYVEYLRKNYNTIFKTRTFQTSYDIDVTIDKGDYGWWMNTQQEAVELAQMIQNGESGEREPAYYQTAAVHGIPDYGDTYVEINLTAQHLLLYVEGELILESDFVSGNSARGFDTPAGIYGITYKERNATLAGQGYRTPVSYWMPFNNNIGMHDAGWRKSFGGNIYKTNGSHGCINLPYAVAEEIYGYIEKGTPVICYYLPGTEPVKKEEETTPADPAEEAIFAEPGQEAQDPAIVVPNPNLQDPTLVLPNPNPQDPTTVVPNPNPQDPTMVLPTPNPQDPTTVVPNPNPQDPTTVVPNPNPQDPTTVVPNPQPQDPTITVPNPNPQEQAAGQ